MIQPDPQHQSVLSCLPPSLTPPPPLPPLLLLFFKFYLTWPRRKHLERVWLIVWVLRLCVRPEQETVPECGWQLHHRLGKWTICSLTFVIYTEQLSGGTGLVKSQRTQQPLTFNKHRPINFPMASSVEMDALLDQRQISVAILCAREGKMRTVVSVISAALTVLP